MIHDPKLPSSFNSGRRRRGYNPDIIFATNRIARGFNKIVMEPWAMLFADDLMLVSETVEEELERWRAVIENKWLIISRSKTEYLVPSHQQCVVTLPTTTHWSASECSYHRANRNFPATIQPEEGQLGAVRTSARCTRGEHPRHSRMLSPVRERLTKSRRKNIPRGCRRNYVPGLTLESNQLIEEYQEKYEDNPFADNTITLGEELMSAISEQRRKAWQTLIE